MGYDTFDNLTAIEDDAFVPNYDGSTSEDDFYTVYSQLHSGIQMFLSYVWSPVVFFSEVCLAYVLLRFKKLRTRRNMYLVNCMCINILTKALLILDFLFIYFELFDETSMSIICVFIEFHNLQHPCFFVVVLLLALDSVLDHYIPDKLRNLERYWLYFMSIVYSVFILSFVIRGSNCFRGQIIFGNKAYLIRYIIFPIIVLTVFSLNVVQQCCVQKSIIGLSIANIILFSYVPIFLYHVIVQFSAAHKIIIHFLYYTEFLADMLAMGVPLILIYFLTKRDQYFKVAVGICLRGCGKIEDIETVEGIDNVANTSLEDV